MAASAGGQARVVAAVDELKRAENEVTFRAANERIREAARTMQPPVERVPFLCECEEPDCHEPILLSAEEYELVRSDGTHFVIVPGHPTRGELVSEHDGHAIVEKTGLSGVIALDTDPRKDEP
jgi:hypothetical protein